MIGKLVFVVDDEADIRALVLENLRINGYNTKEFSEGRSLLKEVTRTKPDLIILDIMMPGIDGLEVCKILKNKKETYDIPIILLTVKGQINDIETGFKVGANAYIVKPFSPSRLIEKVEEIINKFKYQENNN